VRQKPCLDLVGRRSTPEPGRGRARRNLRPTPRGSGETVPVSEPLGVGRGETYAQGRGDRARRCLRPRPRGSESRGLALRLRSQMIWSPCPGVCAFVDDLLCPLRFLSLLIWVSLFMVPNKMHIIQIGISPLNFKDVHNLLSHV